MNRSRQAWIRHWARTCAFDFADFSLEHFIDFLRPTYPLPIYFCRFPLETPRPIGMCKLSRGTAAIIVGQHPALHQALQDFVGLHEIAHLVLRHPLKQMQPDELETCLLQLATSKEKNSLHEQEAEYFAQVVSQRIYDAHNAQPLAPFEIMPRLVEAFAFED